MAELFIPDVEAEVLKRLTVLADSHGRTAAAEAKVILTQALQQRQNSWTAVDAIRERLAASGKQFSDSTDLVREDRDR
jgi:plasmid stability protein